MKPVRAMPRRRKDVPDPPEESVGVTIRFPASLRIRALAVAEAEDRNFNSLVVWAVRRYVTERESQEAQADSGK